MSAPRLDPAAVGSAQLLAGKIAGNAGYFVAALLLARSLGPDGRGQIAFLVVVSLILARVAVVGIGEATTVFAAREPAQRAGQLATAVAFAGAAATLVSLLAGGGLFLVDAGGAADVDGSELAIVVAATVALAIADAAYGFLLGSDRVGRQAAITATSSWLYALLLAVVWVGGGLTVERAALAWALAHVLRAVWALHHAVDVAGLGRPSLSLLRSSLAFGSRAWVGTLARFLNFRADQVLLGFLATESTLGVYAVAVNASEALLYVPSTTAVALLPVVSRGHPRAGVEVVLRGFRSAALVTLGGMLVAALLGPPLLPLAFGSEFQGSVTPFLLLLPGALGFVAMSVFSSGLAASSLPGRSSLGPLVSLALGLALAVVLIPSFAAAGAAAAASSAFLAGGAVSLLLYRRWTEFDWSLLAVPRSGDLDLFRALARPLRLQRHGNV
jgi:O-antigen/teichoic acid export membrane protein